MAGVRSGTLEGYAEQAGSAAGPANPKARIGWIRPAGSLSYLHFLLRPRGDSPSIPPLIPAFVSGSDCIRPVRSIPRRRHGSDP